MSPFPGESVPFSGEFGAKVGELVVLEAEPGATVETGRPEAFAGESLACAVAGLDLWLPTVTCSSLSSAVWRAVCRLEYRLGQSGNWPEPCSFRNSLTAALDLIGSCK